MSQRIGRRGLGASPTVRQIPQAPPRAVGYAGSERALHQAREVDYGQLHPDPGQPRQSMDPDRLDQLADSILAHGVLQPLAVRPADWDAEGDVQYRIVAGGRRYAAIGLALARIADPALRARLARVPVVVVTSEDADIRVLQLIENLQREDLRPVEQARAFKEIMDIRGMSAAELARLIHISDQTVLDRVRLLTDPIIADAVDAGLLSIKAAGLAQKLAPTGLEQVHEQLRAGETVDVDSIARIRSDLDRRGLTNLRGTGARGRPADAAPPAEDPAAGPPPREEEPNRLALSIASNDPASGEAARSPEPHAATFPGATPPLSEMDWALALIADARVEVFEAVLHLLDAAAARRLRYGELRARLVQHRTARSADHGE